MTFKRITTLFVFFILSFTCCSVFAQKESNIWYFGTRAGLDFNYTPARSLDNSVLNTWEGSASIADASGSLLFYTDGTTIWNRKHLQMLNGDGLTGNSSSTQSGVIVPVPVNPNLYYVFTVGAQGGTLDYSIVDISKDTGFGAVTTKNQRLLDLSTEKITAGKHANGRDIWVIGHELESNKFYAWLITPAGISSTPVITSVGSVHGGGGVAAIGYMKASPDGTRIALGAKNGALAYAETLDFNNLTGVLSNPKTLTGFDNVQTVYGIEFSADGELLYILEEAGNNCRLFQVQLPYTAGTIAQRGTVIASQLRWGALQIAPDGRILISQNSGAFLNAISNPSIVGPGCGYVEKAVILTTGLGNGGLPTFIQSFFSGFSFSIANTCINNTSSFKLVSPVTNYDEITWNFGEPSSGLANTSSTRDPTHRYQLPGDYDVILTVKKGLKTSTVTQTVTISPLPTVNLPADVTLFYGEQLALNAGGAGNTYLWNDGSTSATRTITAPGTYSVTATNSGGCTANDEIKITYDQVITSGLPPEAIICKGTTITLDVTLPGAKYLWSDGSTGPTLKASLAGRYRVTITNAYNNRTRTDEIEIKYITFPPLIVPQKTILCQPGIATINASGAGAGQKYNWYDENKVFLEQSTGVFNTPFLAENKTYYVAIADGSCLGNLVPTLVQIDKPYAKIIVADTVINIGESITLQGEGGVSYAWSAEGLPFTSTDQTVTVSPLKNAIYYVTTTNEDGCTALAAVHVIVINHFNIPNTFTPNSDGVNDIWIIPNLNYVLNTVKVYTRDGALVYSTVNYQNNWDGTSRGRTLPFGVYYYVIVADKKTTISGNVTIVK